MFAMGPSVPIFALKKVDSPVCTENGEETGSEATCPSGGAGSSSAGGDQRKHHQLRVAALLAERETWVANSSTPLAFKCLTASAMEEKRDNAPPQSGRSHTGGMGYGYKVEREGWEPHTISLSLALPQSFCYCKLRNHTLTMRCSLFFVRWQCKSDAH